MCSLLLMCTVLHACSHEQVMAVLITVGIFAVFIVALVGMTRIGMPSVCALFALLMLVIVPSPATAERCFPDCYNAECWWVSPQRKRCRQVCRWNCGTPEPRYIAPPPAPRYDPPPQPRYQQPPPYIPPVHQAVASQVDHALLLLGGAAALVIVIALIAGATSRRHSALHIDADIQNTNELTAKLEAAARDADRHIAAAIARAHRGGRHG